MALRNGCLEYIIDQMAAKLNSLGCQWLMFHIWFQEKICSGWIEGFEQIQNPTSFFSQRLRWSLLASVSVGGMRGRLDPFRRCFSLQTMKNWEAVELTLVAGLSGNLFCTSQAFAGPVRYGTRPAEKNGRRNGDMSRLMKNTLPVIFRLVSWETHEKPSPNTKRTRPLSNTAREQNLP